METKRKAGAQSQEFSVSLLGALPEGEGTKRRTLWLETRTAHNEERLVAERGRRRQLAGAEEGEKYRGTVAEIPNLVP